MFYNIKCNRISRVTTFVRLLSTVSLLLIFIGMGRAQTDTIPDAPKKTLFKENTFLKKSILPASLLFTGILLSDSDFEEDLQVNIRNGVGNDFFTSFDDHTRNIPIAQMYIADIAGIEARNHWFDQTKNLVISVLVTDFLTMRLKRATGKQRPDGDDDYESWPSGHTSHAFATATVFYEEFRDSSPVLAHSGYLFAATTAYLRMANNRHYLSDVLAGAGLGILVTKLVYRYEHLFRWNPFVKNKYMTLLPRYSEGTIGFHFVKKF